MFNKKIEFYSPEYTPEELKKYILKFPYNLPAYFKAIPKNSFSLEFKKFLPGNKTIKTCPGFINLYRRSLLFTSPWDLHFLFDDEGIISYQNGAVGGQYTRGPSVEVHPNEQFLNYVPSTKYKFILKIIYRIYCDTNTSIMIHNNFYNFDDVLTPTGFFHPKSSEINYFILIPKEQTELFIKEGQSLALLTPLYHKNIDITYTQREVGRPKFIQRKFLRLKEYLLDKL